jgi:NAD-dependent deacetylase
MKAPSIVILTGAGVSAESGIRTFRDHDGLWESHRIEDVACPEAFERDPALVHRFYNLRRAQLGSGGVRPNAAHEALAAFERDWPGEFLLVTQNVDDLHERAGSRKLLHMHGELLKARCLARSTVLEWREELATDTPCPCCGGRGTLRPHIVWFGEMPFGLERIERALAACDLFVAIGTSGVVYPAAGFVERVRRGARTVEINPEGTPVSAAFFEKIRGTAGTEVPRFLESVRASL